MRIDHKADNGKLLRIEADFYNDILISVSITGDFFIHPESALSGIEELLQGASLRDIETLLEDYIEKNNVQLIGFSITDLAHALRKCKQESFM